MTSVDFYILASGSDMSCEMLACRLAEKAYTKNHRVYLHTGSQNDAQGVSELLWTFSQGSFLPHQMADEKAPLLSPITIGFDSHAFSGNRLEDYDVMINLSQDISRYFSRFTRVAEIVGSEEDARTQSRERYRFYRERGYPLNSHELNA